ncbi:translation initiation factor IF-3 [Planctomicrobium sp.]|jgi:translation initiation factor IF-3|nr:translation initiation factor IF-3 [Planctomicrobium sp.]MDB4439487.1 translation initiation factor IF-3 [Planctomicrobium sp.]
MNDDIRDELVRVVDAEGEMLGEMETAKALELAKEGGMDLVVVGDTAAPPVCRIMDYSKVRYEKKKKSAGPKQHRTQLKQIRLRAKIGEHDVQVKVDSARKFLVRRDKVKINVMFRGRENAHHDLGRDLLNNVIEMLSDVSTVEQYPRMESGRMMSATLTPLAK